MSYLSHESVFCLQDDIHKTIEEFSMLDEFHCNLSNEDFAMKYENNGKLLLLLQFKCRSIRSQIRSLGVAMEASHDARASGRTTQGR